MGEKFVRDDSDEFVETNGYVTEEPRRPVPGVWLAAVLMFVSLGAAAWFWYKAETSQGRPLAVIGQDGPKILIDADEEAPARYVIVREGNRSRIIGGTAVITSPAVDAPNDDMEGSSRAERIATYTTDNPGEFVGPDSDADRIGQTVRIENGRVHEATGDKTFSLHAGNGETLLVFFPEPNSAAGEDAYRIIGGDHLSVTGTLRKMPSPEAARRTFGLSEAESAALTNDSVYLDAYRIEVY